METDTVSMADFIKGNHIRMTAERVDSNPNMDDSANMDHWKCLFRAGNSRMTVYFSMGYGHHGAEPEADEVLDCLASDASGIENARSFEDWCGDYGYDSDSRKAEKIFNTCEHQAKRLRQFLGDSAYETLLWNTERL